MTAQDDWNEIVSQARQAVADSKAGRDDAAIVWAADRLEEVDEQLRDCRLNFAAEFRANEELRREVAYWKNYAKQSTPEEE